MFRKLCVSLSVHVIAFVLVKCSVSTIRQTTNGPIEGIELTSSLGQKYIAFKGIPYAKPPITGIDPFTNEMVDRRFKAPEALNRNWTKPLATKRFGKSCVPSLAKYNKKGVSEDCLFLNVYVPASESRDRKSRTVLVYIHGGAFAHGSATDLDFGPDFLLSQDNIVVTIQYRLGIFGFLTLGYGEYTGNMGLKDQQMALKWVHNNIEHFSGNKHEILLFGQSAGASSVHFHMLNEQSRKYFNRAFAISGSAFIRFTFRKANHVKELQEFTKIDQMMELIEFLKRENASSLAKIYPYKKSKVDVQIKWVPTIENANAVDAFMTTAPDELYRLGKVPPMDTMFSFTAQEAAIFYPHLLSIAEPLIKADWKEVDFELSFENVTRNTHPEKYKRAIEKLRAAYFSDTANVTAIRNANIALMSDLIFRDNVMKATVLQTNANMNSMLLHKSRPKNTFLFRFSIDTMFEPPKKIRNVNAGHGGDLLYLFHAHFLDLFGLYEPHLQRKDDVYKMIMRSVKMITNFARTGDPSVDGDTPFKPCRSANEIFCQNISQASTSSVIHDITNQLHYATWREVEKIMLNNEKGTGNRFNHLDLYTAVPILLVHIFLYRFY